MKRAVLIVAVAALCVAGSAVAQDRSGGLIGSGTRTGEGVFMGSGGFTLTTQDQWLGNGGRAEDRGQMVGSGGLTTSAKDQYLGSGGRTADDGQVLGSGGLIGSGTRSEGSDSVIGDSRGGYLGSGLSVLPLRLPDGSQLLVVSSDEGVFVIPVGE